MYSLLSTLDELKVLIVLPAIAVGIVNCFFGFKNFKLVLALNGFIFGSIIGGILGVIGAIYLDMSDEIIAIVIFISLLCGVMTAVVSYFMYKLGVFLMVSSVVFVGAFALIISNMSFYKLLFLDSGELLLYAFISLVPAVILGGIAILFIKPTVIITTAISGAYEIAWGISIILDDNRLCILITMILAAIGMLVQFSANKKPAMGNTVVPAANTPSCNPVYRLPAPYTSEKNETIDANIDSNEEIISNENIPNTDKKFPALECAATKSTLRLSSDIPKINSSSSLSSKNENEIFSVPDEL